jgi:hypothetical protein
VGNLTRQEAPLEPLYFSKHHSIDRRLLWSRYTLADIIL